MKFRGGLNLTTTVNETKEFMFVGEIDLVTVLFVGEIFTLWVKVLFVCECVFFVC